nr:zinc finger and BTB domain-containing protein 14-like [Parasteatoda tepidariorum]
MSVCEICGKCFSIKSALKRHILEVHEKKHVHSCMDCNKKFVRKSDLKRHTDTVHSSEKISCEVCKTTFARRDNLLHHVNYGNCKRKMDRKRKREDGDLSSKKKLPSEIKTSEPSTSAAAPSDLGSSSPPVSRITTENVNQPSTSSAVSVNLESSSRPEMSILMPKTTLFTKEICDSELTQHVDL